MTNFLNKYTIISNVQFDFREGMSTQDAIVKLTKYIYKYIAQDKESVALHLRRPRLSI